MEAHEEKASKKPAPKNLLTKIALLLWLVTALALVGGGAYWFGTRSTKVSSPSPTPALESEIAPTSASSLTEAVTGTTVPTQAAIATPTATSTPSPSPTPTPTSIGFIPRLFGPALSFPKLNFTASYQGRFTCGLGQAVSFRIDNTGNLDLESWKMTVEGPVGTVISTSSDTAMNNHFRHVATNCDSAGYPKMTPDEPDTWIYKYISPVPTAGTSGKSVIKMCSQDSLGGSCKEVTVNFTF